MNTVKKLAVLCCGAGLCCHLWAGEVKELPKPVITGGMPVMDAINSRISGRIYDSTKPLDEQTLSEVLWVAWGVNTHGTRTVATARNGQNMKLYVLTPTGTWIYDGPKNCLEKVNDENLIPLTAKQPFVNDAPLHLLFVAKDDEWGRCHVGSAYQNVYLYAASKGLATVIRGLIDADALTAKLGLTDGERVIAHQTVGWSKEEK